MGTIVAVHGVLAYAITNGLGQATSEFFMPAIETEIIPDPRPPMQRVSIPEPQIKPPRVEVPPPEIEINIPSENAITDVTTGTAVLQGALPPSGPARKAAPRYVIHARVGDHFPNPDAFYPPASVRREEQGLVTVQVCVGFNGSLTEDPSVTKTSGVARLDEAAIKLARSGRYLAGSVDGLPVIDCLQLPIRFRMKN